MFQYKPASEMMEVFVRGITQTKKMWYTEKPPMHSQPKPQIPHTHTKSELGVSKSGGLDTCHVQNAKSCSHENMLTESRAAKTPLKVTGKHYGAKSKI